MTRQKLIIRRRPPTPVVGPKGEKGDGGPEGRGGARGSKGDRGDDGPKGDTGKSAYQIWRSQGNTGTLEDFLRSLRGKRGSKGAKGPQGFTGFSGSSGRPGPPGPPGEAPAPADSAITRDAGGAVQTVAVEGRPTVTVTRNPDGSVASIVSSERTVTIDRDEAGVVEGTTVTEVYPVS